VADWIDEYNHHRRHSALSMRSPIAYEQALLERPPGQAA
jgi:transposase InsO family protein